MYAARRFYYGYTTGSELLTDLLTNDGKWDRNEMFISLSPYGPRVYSDIATTRVRIRSGNGNRSVARNGTQKQLKLPHSFVHDHYISQMDVAAV